MIQFNLLPDVKIEFIKTRARKRLIMIVCGLVSAVTFGLFVLLFLFVRVNQTKHMRDLSKDIKSETSKLQAVPDIDKILTIQSQLNSLPALHDKKVISSRLTDYLTRMTPNQATISDVEVDFEANTMAIRGNADSLVTVNKFIDAAKFTEYKINADGGANGKAFKNVVLQSFSVASEGKNETAYEIALQFEPAIFAQVKKDTTNGTEPVSLTVPKITSTRSATEKPNSLFAPQPQTQPPVIPGGLR